MLNDLNGWIHRISWACLNSTSFHSTFMNIQWTTMPKWLDLHFWAPYSNRSSAFFPSEIARTWDIPPFWNRIFGRPAVHLTPTGTEVHSAWVQGWNFTGDRRDTPQIQAIVSFVAESTELIGFQHGNQRKPTMAFPPKYPKSRCFWSMSILCWQHPIAGQPNPPNWASVKQLSPMMEQFTTGSPT